MVISGDGSTYSAGGVRVSSFRDIDTRGALIATTNPTDIAIAGRGMLPVTTISDAAGGAGTYPLSMVTTGSFRPDNQGFLRTSSGLVLMGWPANADGTMPTYPRDSTSGLQPVAINFSQFAGDPTTAISLAANLPATQTQASASGDPINASIEYFGNLGTSETLNITYTPTIPASGQSNTWTMVITDSASGGATIGEYTLVFDDTRGVGGTLLSVTPVSGGAYDSATGDVALTVDGGPLTLNIGALGTGDGLTQLSDTYAPISTTNNGTPAGNLTNVQVDENGFLTAIYDTGHTQRIYQIPLVDVPNPNGLISLDNQAYQVSNQSGSFALWDAGSGPTGQTIGFALEESSTDIAQELTNLIQTQRAYSSNAKIIQTVNEMLQETTNIIR